MHAVNARVNNTYQKCVGSIGAKVDGRAGLDSEDEVMKEAVVYRRAAVGTHAGSDTDSSNEIGDDEMEFEVTD